MPGKRTWIFVVLFLAPGTLWFLGVWLYTFRPLPPLPQPSGRVTTFTATEWTHLSADAERCFLVNNTWNRQASGAHFAQEVFDENVAGKRTLGWRWRSPWQMVPAIVSYPEMICGNKPWDEPLGAYPGLPFHPGDRRITADYNIRLQATGVYNLAFSMWGLSNLPSSPANIHCEVMIWIANSELKPAGTRRGTIVVQGTRYGVYINEHQRDKSGLINHDWIYVAYVAHRQMLNGPLDVNAFIEDLQQRKILTPDLWLTDLELGNEVSQGSGITEIQDFAIHLD